MLLRRQYHEDKLVRDKDGKVTEVKPGAVKGVEVLKITNTQHLTGSFLEGGESEGWLSRSGDVIVIKNLKGSDVRYKIVRRPGYYCCHCKKAVDDGQSALIHLAAQHQGVTSPDPSNPAGYERINYYDCVKE